MKAQKNSEHLFLQGHESRWREFRSALKIMLEFIRGFRRLHFLAPCITVFGSSRFDKGHKYYIRAVEFGEIIAKKGFSVMTGGGPGIMEAANRGAKIAKGCSVGCNIRLPHEQAPNPYLDVMIEMDHFYVRKVLLVKYSYAFVVFPGGFGTLDELFETLVLMQTDKIRRFPLVLFGSRYWNNLLEQIEDMKVAGTISPSESSLFLVTDSVEEGMQYILDSLKEKYGQAVQHRKFKRRWWLGENHFGGNNHHVIELNN